VYGFRDIKLMLCDDKTGWQNWQGADACGVQLLFVTDGEQDVPACSIKP
jgi:hypothetical protein